VVLRPYQLATVERCRSLVNSGRRRIVFVAPCGAGKGTVLAHILASTVRKGNRGLALTHRRELVEDLAERVGQETGEPPGVILAGVEEHPERPIQVASVQTLARRDKPPADIVLVDECFPAGSLVDGRPIESLREGDPVLSFDEATGRMVRSRVLRVFCSAPRALLRLVIDGTEIRCTPNHPFFTARGWREARALEVDDAVLCSRMHLVWSSRPTDDDIAAVAMVFMEEIRTRLLLGGAQKTRSRTEQLGSHGENEPSLCLGQNEGPQSDEARGRPPESERQASRDRPPPSSAGRQRTSSSASSVDAVAIAGGWLVRRVRREHGAASEVDVPNLLQDRHRAPSLKDSGRGGWRLSLRHRDEGQGREEGHLLAWARVDRTEVLEPGSDGTFGGMCPGRKVYNLEVAGTHAYFVNGFLVHNCHHASASSWREILDHYPSSAILGSTASPCRLSGAPLGDIFEELVELVKPAELVDAGHLVPVRGFAYDAPDLRGVRRTAGDFDGAELADLMGSSRLRGNVVEQYQERARGTRALVFAVNVAHSRQLALQFAAAGVTAQHLDGETPRPLRKRIFEAFRAGTTRVLCNVGLFSEGIDLPAIETVILARPTLSLALAIQMVGRGRRPVPCTCGRIPHWRHEDCACGLPVTKRFARLHDHAGVLFQHGLPDEPRVWSLAGDFRVGVGEKGKGEASAALRTCRKCFAVYLADGASCPLCGFVNPVKRRLVRNARGVAVSLADIERSAKPPPATPEQARGYFFYLLGVERQRAYKRGWAEIRWMSRYKHWPHGAKAWRAEFVSRPRKVAP
jgi:superfamily II DNA or RNA helicase